MQSNEKDWEDCGSPRRRRGPGLWRVLEGGKQFMAPRLVGISRCSLEHGWPGWRRWHGTGSSWYPFLSGINAQGSEELLVTLEILLLFLS